MTCKLHNYNIIANYSKKKKRAYIKNKAKQDSFVIIKVLNTKNKIKIQNFYNKLV